MNERITIDTPDGSFGAYVARPATSPAPAIVVVQEIFGINADMRETCDTLAALGYIAVCPDLFWRLEPGVELSDQSQAEWKKGLSLYQAFDIDKGVGDVATTMAKARTLPGASGKCGVMGFCLGGLITFLTAARHGADAAVAYYGGRTDEYVAEFAQLKTPLMMHLAEADEFIPAEARAKIIAAAKDHPQVQVFTYPGQNHAFARLRGIHFNAQAAKLANDRTYDFFDLHLKPEK